MASIISVFLRSSYYTGSSRCNNALTLSLALSLTYTVRRAVVAREGERRRSKKQTNERDWSIRWLAAVYGWLVALPVACCFALAALISSGPRIRELLAHIIRSCCFMID